MTVSLLGAVMIIAACVIFGQMGAAQLRRQRLFLLGVEQGLLSLMREIEYLARPLSEALLLSAKSAGAASELFAAAAAQLQQGAGLSGEEAWRAAVAGSPFSCSAEEKRVLLSAGDGLGSSDIATQLRQLELARRRVAQIEQQAAEREQKYGRIWRSMGWAGGALLVLLMI